VNKYIVCFSDGGRVENIIDATGLYELYLEQQLLTNKENRNHEKFAPLVSLVDSINRMELRMRYNAQRNPALFVVDIDMGLGDLWDKLEYDGDFYNLVKETSTPFYRKK
jgi:hypothetical protein